MTKFIAILNVIAWSGFWAFGYIALTTSELTTTQMAISALLAFIGLIIGIAAYLRLVRAAEESGYARRSNQLSAADRDRAHAQQVESLAEVEGRS